MDLRNFIYQAVSGLLIGSHVGLAFGLPVGIVRAYVDPPIALHRATTGTP